MIAAMALTKESYGRLSILALRGTDDATGFSQDRAQRQAQHSGRETVQFGAAARDLLDKNDSQQKTLKHPTVVGLDDPIHSSAATDKSTPGRIRTCDLRIRRN